MKSLTRLAAKLFGKCSICGRPFQQGEEAHVYCQPWCPYRKQDPEECLNQCRQEFYPRPAHTACLSTRLRVKNHLYV